jgi:hypothetical protein
MLKNIDNEVFAQSIGTAVLNVLKDYLSDEINSIKGEFEIQKNAMDNKVEIFLNEHKLTLDEITEIRFYKTRRIKEVLEYTTSQKTANDFCKQYEPFYLKRTNTLKAIYKDCNCFVNHYVGNEDLEGREGYHKKADQEKIYEAIDKYVIEYLQPAFKSFMQKRLLEQQAI